MIATKVGFEKHRQQIAIPFLVTCLCFETHCLLALASLFCTPKARTRFKQADAAEITSEASAVFGIEPVT